MPAESDFLALVAGRRRGVGAMLARAGLSAAEPFYAAAMRARNNLFDRGLKPAVPLGRPTISVGNLTVGGTGKTPVVLWLADRFLATGHRPAVLLRGYKAKDGLSDEAELYRQVPGLEVEANPDRVAGAGAVLTRSPGTSVFLLDDAFQHRRAARDFDLVLLDATEPFGHGHVLPRGLLREPATGLARADGVLLTRVRDRATAVVQQVRALNPTAPVYQCRHVLRGLIDPDGRPIVPAALGPVVAAAGIGNPRAFFEQLRGELRLNVVNTLALPDHDAYDAPTLARLRQHVGPGRTLITTEKDWTKLRRCENLNIPIARAVLGLDFADGDADALWTQIRRLVLSPGTPGAG